MRKIYSIDNFLHFATPYPKLPIARGFIESLLPLGEGKSHIQVSGWLILPSQPIDSIELYVEDKYINTYELQPREDVQNAFPWIPHSLTSGFSIPVPSIESMDTNSDANASEKYAQRDLENYCITKISLIACRQGNRVGRLPGFIYKDIELINLFPSPPEDYMFRVANIRDALFFKVGAIQTFSQFMEAACQHTDFHCVQRILDWGCGCGRLTTHLLSIIYGAEVFGCDIDSEAIEWSNNNIRSGAFSLINPLPPTEYSSNSFDVIFSYSVFTHLTRDVQHSWLSEMQRILKPGGLFIATIHGEFALQFALESTQPQITGDGIMDYILDPILDNIAPKNYYRATFQTKEYTLQEFGKYFSIVDYIERGAMNFQDIVILRKI